MKGKIYRIDNIFKHQGADLRESSYSIVADIENAKIEDYMIEFFIKPHQAFGGTFSYKVRLQSVDGINYAGKWYDDTNGDVSGEVKCEIFSNLNQSKYFIYGIWDEEVGKEQIKEYYTWWSNIFKDKQK